MTPPHRAATNAAMQSLARAEHAINKLVFPNVSSLDFNLIKNGWNQIPKEFANEVMTMGLHISDDYNSLICNYKKDRSRIEPHLHPDEWEYLLVIEGDMVDHRTGVHLEKGEVYIIPPGEVHEIESTVESYYYIVFTKSKEILDDLIRKGIVEYEYEDFQPLESVK